MEREEIIKRPITFAAVLVAISAWCAVNADDFVFATGLAALLPVIIAVGKQTGRKMSCYLYLIIYVSSYFYFIWRISPISIDSYIKENEPELTVSGKVKSVTQKDNYYSVILNECIIYCGDIKEKTDGIILYASENNFEVSDKILVSGTVKGFEKVRNEGGFDSKRYYESIGVNYRMSAESIEVCDSGRKNLYKYLSDIREKLADIYTKISPQKEAGIFTSVILGDKSSIDKDVKKLYQRNGIAHLLAISGLHISLIGMSLYKLLRRVGVSFAMSFSFGSLMVIFYGLLTGSTVSAVRAVIMCLLIMLSELIGRTYDMLSALSAAAILIITDNPKVLYNSGFLMSFCAILGIAVIYPVLQNIFVKDEMLPPVKYLLSALLVSISVNLTTFPVILYSYYEFPPYSVLLNLIVIPLMSLLMLSVAAAGIAGLINIAAGKFLIGQAYYILKFYEELCSFTEKLPYSNVITGKPRETVIAVYVLLLLLFVALSVSKRIKYSKKMLFLPVAAVVVMCLFSGRKSGFEIDVIDVGQGDGILLMTPEGKNYLFDGGSQNEKQLADNILLPLLKSKGISKIDYAVISHSDEDHISGVLEIIQQDKFIIDTLVLPAIDGYEKDENYCKLETCAIEKGVKIQYASAGTKLGTETVSIKCLHPETGYAYTSANDYSAVYQITYGEFDMLLTGDAEVKAEQAMSDRRCLSDIDILKVGHHGSKTSTGEAFLKAVKPEAAVISCGRNNRYNHPSQEIVDRLSENNVKTFVTSELGELIIRSDGKSYSIRQWN